MNYKNLGKILGKIMVLEGVLMLAPLLVTFFYREGLRASLAFLIPIVALICIGGLAQLLKPKRTALYQKEGFALVALAWIVMTLFGAIPFVINGDIPNYIDACFEIMSGFTTTGASILTNVSALSHSSLFWRSFSHWIGGMGILVFILIFIPEGNEGTSMHLLRAESPGPQVGKLVSKMKVTTRILYLIYLGLTLLEIVILMFDKPLPGHESDQLFYSILSAFGCAGTGGFGFRPDSMASMPPFSQYVMAVFMLLFGCNFSIYYFLLIGKFRNVLKSEELRTYLFFVVSGVLFVFLGLVGRVWPIDQAYSLEEAFRHSFFQVASIITTTGFTTTDYNLWPPLSAGVLVVMMFTGAMAGSTAGGIKISRIVIALKGLGNNVRKLINPRYVPKAKFEGKTISGNTIMGVFSFITLYIVILVTVSFLLGLDPVGGQVVSVSSDAIGGAYEVRHGFWSNFSATLACISNVGPAFEAVGPYVNYAAFSWFSKILLSFTMLLGRLEILPVLVLFSPKTWKKT